MRCLPIILLVFLSQLIFSQSPELSVIAYDNFDNSEKTIPIRYLGMGKEHHYFLFGKYPEELKNLSIREFDIDFVPTGRSWDYNKEFDFEIQEIYDVVKTENKTSVFVKVLMPSSKEMNLIKLSVDLENFTVSEKIIFSSPSKDIEPHFFKRSMNEEGLYSFCYSLFDSQRGNKTFLNQNHYNQNGELVRVDSISKHPYKAEFLPSITVFEGSVFETLSNSFLSKDGVRIAPWESLNDYNNEAVVGQNLFIENRSIFVGAAGRLKGGVSYFNGIYYRNVNLSDSTDIISKFFPFSDEFFEIYLAKNTHIKPRRKDQLLEQRTFWDMKPNGNIIREDGSVEIIFKVQHLGQFVITKFDENGNNLWMKYLKSSHWFFPVSFTRIEEEENRRFSFEALKDETLLIFNGLKKEVSTEHKPGSLLKVEFNEAIILYRIDGEGNIERQNLMEFQSKEDSYIFFESKSFKIDENRILLFTTKFGDVKQQRFIEISTN